MQCLHEASILTGAAYGYDDKFSGNLLPKE